MSLPIRRLLQRAGVALPVLILGAGAALLPQSFAQAQTTDFPKSPVKIIIPFPPGGPTDTVARMIGGKLQEIWGQPVVLDYKPGGGTVIGVDFVAKALADGYTMVMVNSALAVNQPAQDHALQHGP